ncbi:MAG: hypothetical protein M3R12_07290 [Actinomycetota bacterium]|nr:hypothetical protein [Actinomycetota bacterium]
MHGRGENGLERLWRLSGLVFQVPLAVGAIAAVAGWRPSALLIFCALAGLVASHVAISVVSYRRTMRRPWPRVEPLHDDPWD